VPSGTRDPVFFENYAMIKAAVIELIKDEFPDALANASYTISDADASNPAVLLRTVDRDPLRLEALHGQEIDQITAIAKPRPSSRMNLDAPDAYVWSLCHLLRNEEVIKNEMFPIAYYRANGSAWHVEAAGRPIYFDIGEAGYSGSLDDRTLSLIADAPPAGHLQAEQHLRDMAVVIRSKDAGINRLTFDIIFNCSCHLLRRRMQRNQDLHRSSQYLGVNGRTGCLRSAATCHP
jgi:hypothetical protein